MVEAAALQFLRQVGLGGVAFLVVVSVLVAGAVVEFFHQLGGGVADVQRHRQGAGFSHFGQGLVDADVGGVALGGGGEVGDSLGEVDAGFGQADEVHRLLHRQGDLQPARVGVADILGGEDDHPAGDEQWVFAGFEHARQPVEGAVGGGAAQALDEGGNDVVVLLGPLVVEQGFFLQGLADGGRGQLSSNGQGGGGEFQGVEGDPGIALGHFAQLDQGRIVGAELLVAEAAGIAQGPLQQQLDLFGGEGVEHEDPGAGEQGRVDFEGGVFGGGADENDVAALDEGEKGVLLGLVEAVDFIDEQQGLAAVVGFFFLGLLDDFADFLDSLQHRRKKDEAGFGRVADDLPQGGFAGAGRAPENHRAELVGLDQPSQQPALGQNVLLADHLFQAGRAQAFRQGRAGGLGQALFEEIHREPSGKEGERG